MNNRISSFSYSLYQDLHERYLSDKDFYINDNIFCESVYNVFLYVATYLLVYPTRLLTLEDKQRYKEMEVFINHFDELFNQKYKYNIQYFYRNYYRILDNQ